jgi:hypothetical protein
MYLFLFYFSIDYDEVTLLLFCFNLINKMEAKKQRNPGNETKRNPDTYRNWELGGTEYSFIHVYNSDPQFFAFG